MLTWLGFKGLHSTQRKKENYILTKLDITNILGTRATLLKPWYIEYIHGKLNMKIYPFYSNLKDK